MTRAQLKQKSKQQIKGKVGILFLIMLVAVLIALAINIVPVVGQIVEVFVVTPALSLALCGIFLEIAKENKTPAIGDLFTEFNRWWDSFKVIFLTGLFVGLWSLLFVIPGIIKGFSYSQALYIIKENPGMPALEAIRRSKEMMNGRKMDYFVLGLSFIGWEILASFTFGILYIWLAPYMSVTYTNFYLDIKPAAPVAEAVAEAAAEPVAPAEEAPAEEAPAEETPNA